MLIQIDDDFDLKKIADSGQCFRVREFDNGIFRFVTGDNILYVHPASAENSKEYEVSCDESEWNNIWKQYFDLDRSYSEIRENIPNTDEYMQSAAECGQGIRVLKQDPWEMLISFIISQRKSIPAIKTSIELICAKFGKSVVTEYEEIFLFPTAEEIYKRLSDDGNCLSDCKLGYRLKYIEDAIRRVFLKEIDLDEFYSYNSVELLCNLKQVYGVGDKVANCIALFAYNRCELAPVDTWIKKVIEGVYSGVNPFPSYGDVAGIMQQYIFYYALTHKQEF